MVHRNSATLFWQKHFYRWRCLKWRHGRRFWYFGMKVCDLKFWNMGIDLRCKLNTWFWFIFENPILSILLWSVLAQKIRLVWKRWLFVVHSSRQLSTRWLEKVVVLVFTGEFGFWSFIDEKCLATVNDSCNLAAQSTTVDLVKKFIGGRARWRNRRESFQSRHDWAFPLLQLRIFDRSRSSLRYCRGYHFHNKDIYFKSSLENTL